MQSGTDRQSMALAVGIRPCVLLFEDKMAGTRALGITELHRAEFINELVAQLRKYDLFNRKGPLLRGAGGSLS